MPLPQTAECKMNVAHVLFPAISLTTNIYVPLPVMFIPLVYALPLIVAVTHGLLSAK